MKKIISFITVVAMLLSLMMIGVSAASATVTGNSTLKAGDTLTLTLKFNTADLYGFEGDVTYDSSKIEFQSAKFSNTAVTFNYNDATKHFTAFSASVISTSDSVQMTFKVKATLAAGTSVTVGFSNLLNVVGIMCEEQTVPSVSYTKAIATPAPAASSDATLSSLKLTNANGGAAIALTPSFNKNVVSYTVTVPYEVSKVNVSATATHSKAKVTGTGAVTLKENSTTTVNVKVQAEDGKATKTYTIKITRPSDPNYKPSTNADLASLTVSGQTLSPAFSKNTTAYTVSVPSGVSSVKVTAKAADAKAKVAVSGGSNLVAGADNKVTVTCTAESGAKKVYTITVKRAALPVTTAPDVPNVPDNTDAPDAPAIDTTLVDELTGVSCFIPAGKAPAGTEFMIQEITSGDEYDICAAAAKEGAFKFYSPALVANGVQIQPTGTVKMTFPALEGIDSESAHVYSVVGGVLTEIPFTSVDGQVVIETHEVVPVAIFASAVDGSSTETGVDTEALSTDIQSGEESGMESDTEGEGTDSENKSGIAVSVLVVSVVAAFLVGMAGGIVIGAALKSKKNKESE